MAGSFYPAQSAALRAAVTAFVECAFPKPVGLPLRAVIAPHAGYIYSGPVAGTAFAALAKAAPRPTRVALLGPSHYVAFSGLALPESEGLETPLGVVAVDRELASLLRGFSRVIRWEKPHQREHSLEVQLPFLQCVVPSGLTVVPLVVGRCMPSDVADVIESMWDMPDVVVVVSTDLSHYLPADEARAVDGRTAALVVAKNCEALDPEMACGYYPLAGLILAARRRGLSVDLLDLRNSGDTSGDPDRVVGYGSFAVAGSGRTAPRSRSAGEMGG